MDVPRILDLPKLLAAKSYFLFGPRQTGKTYMIRRQFPKAKYYNLHETDTFLKFNYAPHRLRQELTNKDKLVIIDEIQKLPLLLDEIQMIIDDRQVRFLLTGSSARSLKRKGLNLLGGERERSGCIPCAFGSWGKSSILSKRSIVACCPRCISLTRPMRISKRMWGAI